MNLHDWTEVASANAELLGKVLLVLADTERRLIEGHVPEGVDEADIHDVVEFFEDVAANVAQEQANYVRSITDPFARIEMDERRGVN